jgi:hypothetical protein
MRTILTCWVAVCLALPLVAQSLRPLTDLEYGAKLYSAQRNQLYVFEGRENKRSAIKIIDAVYGKVKKNLKTDSIPSLQVMSADERYIYFVTYFPNRISRLDLQSEKLEPILTLPNGIEAVNGLKILPGSSDRLVISWYNESRVGISLIENGKLYSAKDPGIFAFQSILLANDSTFFAVTGINQQLIKGEIRPAYIAISDTIEGLPYLDFGNGMVVDDFYYSPNGYVIDLRPATPVLVDKLVPDPQFFYTQITTYPSSPYLYIVQELINDFKVFKISKTAKKLVESWAVAKSPGSSGFTLFTAISQDGFFLSNYSISYLYKRCSAKTPIPKIREGTNAFACVLKDSTLTLHANDAAYEYLWSSGETTSSLTFKTNASIQLQYGDSLGCLSEPSPITNVFFNPPRQYPWINGKYEPFSIQVCRKQSTLLSAMESGIQEYEWSNGETGIEINASKAGEYRVRSIAPDGCPSLWSFPVTVEQLPDTIPVKPTIKATKGSFNYCTGEIAELYVPSGYLYYIWLGQKTSNPFLRVNYDVGASVQVGNDPRCLSSLSDPAFVKYYPIPQTPVVQRLTNLLATNSFGEKHEWYFNKQLIPGENGQFLTITENGQYSVRTLVNGCYSSYSATITVQDLLTSNRSIQKKIIQILLSPNPVQQVLQVKTNGIAFFNSWYQILGVDGKIFQQGFLPTNGLLKLDEMPQGLYILQIRDEQKHLGIARFIKQ